MLLSCNSTRYVIFFQSITLINMYQCIYIFLIFCNKNTIYSIKKKLKQKSFMISKKILKLKKNVFKLLYFNAIYIQWITLD